MGKNLNARRCFTSSENLFPEIEILLWPEDRRAQVPVEPAGKARQIREEVPHVVPERVGEPPVKQPVLVIHLSRKGEVMLNDKPKPAQHVC